MKDIVECKIRQNVDSSCMSYRDPERIRKPDI